MNGIFSPSESYEPGQRDAWTGPVPLRVETFAGYEHQRPAFSVAWLIAVHVLLFGFLVSPHGLHL
jgi:hypothetical protein